MVPVQVMVPVPGRKPIQPQEERAMLRVQAVLTKALMPVPTTAPEPVREQVPGLLLLVGPQQEPEQVLVVLVQMLIQVVEVAAAVSKSICI
jgi:hypothetical protein